MTREGAASKRRETLGLSEARRRSLKKAARWNEATRASSLMLPAKCRLPIASAPHEDGHWHFSWSLASITPLRRFAVLPRRGVQVEAEFMRKIKLQCRLRILDGEVVASTRSCWSKSSH